MPNAKVLESKKAIVGSLSDQIKAATAVVFTDYRGITGEKDRELRNQFRDAGVRYTVVKNTLTRRAANDLGYTEFDELLNGTTSMAITDGDPIAPARILSEFIRKNQVMQIKGGLIEGKPLSVDELKAFGDLPSKDALLAQVLGTFLAPISSLAYVLDQAAQKMAAGELPAAAAEAAPAEEAAPEAPAEAPAEASAEEAAPEAPAEA